VERHRIDDESWALVARLFQRPAKTSYKVADKSFAAIINGLDQRPTSDGSPCSLYDCYCPPGAMCAVCKMSPPGDWRGVWVNGTCVPFTQMTPEQRMRYAPPSSPIPSPSVSLTTLLVGGAVAAGLLGLGLLIARR
jgi:hypothetical protein